MGTNNSSKDVRFSLNKIRGLIKEADEARNVIDLNGKANLYLRANGIEIDDQSMNELKGFLEELVDGVDNRITDFVVELGQNIARIKTAIEGNSVRVNIDLLASDNPNDQISFETVGPVKVMVIDKITALRQFLNPKRTEFLINLTK